MTETPKPSRRGTFFWNAAFSILGLALALISTFVLIPLYLKYIDSKVYGAWLASGSIISWLGMIDPGISLVIQQKVAFAYGASDKKELGEWAGVSILLNGVIAALIVAVGVGVASYLPSLLKLTPDIPSRDLCVSFAWAVIGTGFSIFSFGLASINIGLQSRFGSGAINSAAQLLRLVLIYVFLISGFGLVSIGLAGAVSGVFAALACALYMGTRLRRERVRVSLSLPRMRSLLGFLSYTSLFRIGNNLFQYLDLLIVARVLGTESVTILRLTRSPAEICGAFAQRPAAAIQAPITHLLGVGDKERAREVSMRFLQIEIWLILYMTGGILALNECFVGLWVGNHFYGGVLLNLAIVFGLVLQATTLVLFNLVFAIGNIKRSSLVYAIQGLIYVAIVYPLTSRYSLLGAVGASVVSYLMVPIWYFPRSFSRLLGIERARWWQVCRTALAGCAAALAAVVIERAVADRTPSWTVLGTRGVVYTSLFFGGLWLASGVFRVETARLLRWFACKVRRPVAIRG